MLTPLFGFSSITAPEVTAEIHTITEGNWFFKKKVIKGGDVGNITLSRGVAFYDSDFWRWINTSLAGDLARSRFEIPGLPASLDIGGTTPRRTLLLLQMIPRLPAALPEGSEIMIQTTLQAAAAAIGSTTEGEGGTGSLGAGIATAGIRGLAFSAFGALVGDGAFEFVARLPAKMWLLHGCLPVKYKAGTDFDASTSQISIQSIELVLEGIEEISLAG